MGVGFETTQSRLDLKSRNLQWHSGFVNLNQKKSNTHTNFHNRFEHQTIMGKKKNAEKDEAKAIRHTEKAAKLLAKKERKTNANSDCVLDPDIVAMREFQKEQLQNQQDSKGIVQISPNPASNASLDVVPVSVPLPGEKPSSSLCVTFGGEYTDGARVVTNNDLYLLKLTVTDSNSAPNAPPPIPNPIPNPNPSTQYADDNSLATWYKVNTSTSPPPAAATKRLSTRTSSTCLGASATPRRRTSICTTTIFGASTSRR